MNEKETIKELVIKAGELEGKYGWNVEKNLLTCPDCLGHLCYVKEEYGVVAEKHEYMVVRNRNSRTYDLRVIGLTAFCAKCGFFIERYGKFVYPEDDLVMYAFDFGELDDDEIAELRVCLQQYNQTGKITTRYKSNLFDQLKTSLGVYEKKHPLKPQNKKKSRSKLSSK